MDKIISPDRIMFCQNNIYKSLKGKRTNSHRQCQTAAVVYSPDLIETYIKNTQSKLEHFCKKFPIY